MNENEYTEIVDAIYFVYDRKKADKLFNELDNLVKERYKLSSVKRTITLDELKNMICFVIDTMKEQVKE